MVSISADIAGDPRRRDTRVPVKLWIELWTEDTTYHGWLRNLSAGGGYLELDDGEPAADARTAWLCTPACGEPTEVELRYRTRLDERRWGAGIQFSKRGTFLYQLLEEVLNEERLREDLFLQVVHDLRNPLASLDGYLQLLQAEPGAGAFIDYVQGAVDSAGQIRELIEDILGVRLLEEAQLALRREPLKLGALLDQAVATLEGAARARTVRIDLRVEENPTISADGKLARRAIENVLMNALKYSRPGGTISVAGTMAGGCAAIEVADRGPGIPCDLKQAIFDKFASVEARKGGARRGFGLGLSFVKLVLKAHGGDVSVLDREGGGAVFRLLFPLDGARR